MYVFKGGSPVNKLFPADRLKSLHYGTSLAIHDGTLVVGAPGVSLFAGYADVWDVSSGVSWVTRLEPAELGSGDRFGSGVGIFGNVIVCGASGDDDVAGGMGAVYIYSGNGGAWVLDGKFTDPSAFNTGAWLGGAVAVSGQIAIVGAHGDDNFFGGLDAGAAYFIVANCDRDGDGLLDDWEINGLDVNNDGTIDLDLPGLGADPDHKDLFVEIDTMKSFGFHSQAESMVVAAFANAPVSNPDGVNGIKLHTLVDETRLTDVDFPNGMADFDVVKAASFGTPNERRKSNWPNIKKAKEMTFRYCIFGRSYDGSSSSGLAERPGDDFMVTLGRWNTPGGTIDQQAGTFMHEFGHTLNHGHGGIDDINYKPNYYSIMNYFWQTPHTGYANLWRLDYSRFKLADLNEAALIEADGIDGSDPVYAAVRVMTSDGADPPVRFWTPTDGRPVDWDGDRVLDAMPVAVDINYLYLCKGLSCPSPGELLRGRNDWANIWYRVGGHTNFADGVRDDSTLAVEIDHDESLALDAEDPPPPLPDPCPADLNGDGVLDFFDVSAFLTAFNSGDLSVDFNGDGVLDFFDVSEFLTAFSAGCP